MRKPAGYVEVVCEEIRVFNTSEPPPFPVDEETHVSEETKLRYRFIDLRRNSMRENLLFRHRLYQITRNFFTERGFVEIETPVLTKSTPEGARDFIVPSRLHPSRFYALPQSPQLFKQILMVSGFDRYFQIVKCFRDEDLRADRQPEFTQIDYEMSFVGEEEVMDIAEELLEKLFQELLGVKLRRPFDRIPYREAMEKYGTDKPDRRFGLELVDLSDVFRETEFRVFRSALEKGGVVKALTLKGVSLSRKDIEELTSFVQGLGARGLAWVRVEEKGISSPIAKFFSEKGCPVGCRFSPYGVGRGGGKVRCPSPPLHLSQGGGRGDPAGGSEDRRPHGKKEAGSLRKGTGLRSCS